eukprot:1150433-Pelagomonas_calceolata.AAC.1
MNACLQACALDVHSMLEGAQPAAQLAVGNSHLMLNLVLNCLFVQVSGECQPARVLCSIVPVGHGVVRKAVECKESVCVKMATLQLGPLSS